MSSPEVKLILSLIDQTKEGLAQAGLNVKSYGDTVEQESRKIVTLSKLSTEIMKLTQETRKHVGREYMPIAG